VTEDRGGLDVNHIISSHLGVSVRSHADGYDDRPNGIATSAGTKGGNSFSDEENGSFCLNATIMMSNGEEITEKGARAKLSKETPASAFAFE
jgi:hypothetical protein